MTLVLVIRALLLLSGQAAAGPVPSEETVIWFGGAPPKLDERALLDAVSVYTRDLRLAVRSLPGAIPAAAPDRGAAAGAVLRAQGARLGFWCEARPDGSALSLTTVDWAGRLEVHAVEDAHLDEPELYRALALKLRSVLVAVVGTEVLTAGRSPAAPAPSTPAVPPRAEGAAPTLSAAPPQPPASGDRSSRPLFSAGYRASAVRGVGLRNGFLAEVGYAFRRPLELALAVELAPSATGATSKGAVSVFDLPVALTARAVTRGRRWTFGGGPFASVHLLRASATANDGAAVDSFSAAAGLGASAIARLRMGRGIAAQLSLDAEAVVPTTRYWVRGVPTLELGSRLGVALGIVIPNP